jgi:hypothetical protein
MEACWEACGWARLVKACLLFHWFRFSDACAMAMQWLRN